MNWYLEVLKKYATFSGRARRTEYWMFTLVNAIIGFIISFVEGLLGLSNDIGGVILSGIYGLGILLPSLAVSVRRLQDTGRSGWWILLGLIPIVGWIMLIIFLVKDSEPGDNEYGPNPKGVID